MANVTQKISLENVRFYSPIGYYEEEQILGNEFFVTVTVCYPFKNPDSENINNTVNYEELYQVLVEIMSPKRKLLESAAEDILNKIIEKYSFLNEVEINIRKINPPFGGDVANSVVSLIYSKDH